MHCPIRTYQQHYSFLTQYNVAKFIRYCLENAKYGEKGALTLFGFNGWNIVKKIIGESTEKNFKFLLVSYFCSNNYEIEMMQILENYTPYLTCEELPKEHEHDWFLKKNVEMAQIQHIPFNENKLKQYLTVENTTQFLLFLSENNITQFPKCNMLLDMLTQCMLFCTTGIMIQLIHERMTIQTSFVQKIPYGDDDFIYVLNDTIGVFALCEGDAELVELSDRPQQIHYCLCETENYCEFLLNTKRNCLVTIMNGLYNGYEPNNVAHGVFTNEFIVQTICSFF